MKTSRRRGATVRALSLATLALALGLAGCGVEPSPDGSQPQTTTTYFGVNIDASNHSVALRGLYVISPGEAGYHSGAKASLSVTVWNNTDAPVNLTGVSLGATALELVGTAEAGVTTFEVLIPPGGSVALDEASGRYLQIACMPAEVPLGAVLPLTFTFDNDITIDAQAPVGTYDGGTPIPTTGSAVC